MTGANAHPDWQRVKRFLTARGTQAKLAKLQLDINGSISQLMHQANIQVMRGLFYLSRS